MAHLGYPTGIVFGLSAVIFARPFSSVRGSATFAFTFACLLVTSWTFSFTRARFVDSFPNSSVCSFVPGIVHLLGFGVCPPAFICLYPSHVIVISDVPLRAVDGMAFYLFVLADFNFVSGMLLRVPVFRCLAYADRIFVIFVFACPARLTHLNDFLCRSPE